MYAVIPEEDRNDVSTPKRNGEPPTKGPGRPSLVEPAEIVSAATDMIERDGLEGFSMRPLAKQLGVWPTTIYNHFDGKEAVLDEVADHFLDSIPLPSPDALSWDEWLEHFAAAVYRAWTAHPRLLAVVMTRPGRGDSIARMLDVFLGVLRTAGFAAEEAHSAWHTVQNHLFGEVYQVAQWGTEPKTGRASARIGDRDASAYPTLAEWGHVLDECDRTEEFQIGMRIIIRGLSEHAGLAAS